jgi:hypothetical protein
MEEHEEVRFFVHRIISECELNQMGCKDYRGVFLEYKHLWGKVACLPRPLLWPLSTATAVLLTTAPRHPPLPAAFPPPSPLPPPCLRHRRTSPRRS